MKKEKLKINYFIEKSKEARFHILNTLYYCKGGHPGGSFSIVEVLVSLYFKYMNINEENIKTLDRDRFILSKGHASVALYTILALKGIIKIEELKNFDKINSILQAHPDMNKTPGVDFTTGSLGQGLSAAVGIAIGLKKIKSLSRVFVIMGDGEMQEGQIWEAMMLANKYRLDNIVAILDKNNLQLSGSTCNVCTIENIIKKIKAFGFHIHEVNGHDFKSIFLILDHINNKKPGELNFIIAHTIKGKGMSFMENSVEWHGGRLLTQDEFNIALEELNYKDNSGIWNI